MENNLPSVDYKGISHIYSHYQFIDMIDYNNDGMDEIVISIRGYEDLRISMLSKIDGSWKEIHEMVPYSY